MIIQKGEQMTTEPNLTEQEHQKPKVIHQRGASEAVYGLGLIGACVYYFSHAATFWLGVLGFFKAIVWPAMLVYDVLKFLNM
jgi:hypothetical protein